MAGIGRLLVIGGLVLLALGVGVLVLGRFGVPLGRLPGDLRWQSGNTEIFAPLGTCLLLSVLLTVVLAVVNHLRR